MPIIPVNFKMYYDHIKVPIDHFSGITQGKVHMIWLIILVWHIFLLTLFLHLNCCAPRPRLISSPLINTNGWTKEQITVGLTDGCFWDGWFQQALVYLELKSRGPVGVVAVAIEKAYAKWSSLFLELSLQLSYVHCCTTIWVEINCHRKRLYKTLYYDSALRQKVTMSVKKKKVMSGKSQQ